jgi:hypothetical protein
MADPSYTGGNFPSRLSNSSFSNYANGGGYGGGGYFQPFSGGYGGYGGMSQMGGGYGGYNGYW